MTQITHASGYRFLFLSLLALLVAYPVLGSVEVVRPFIDGLVYVVLIAGVLVAKSNLRQLVAVTILGVLTFVSLYSAETVDERWLQVASTLLGVTFFGFLAQHILRDILFGRAQVTGDMIFAALAVYLLIGVAFAFFYQLIATLDSGAFAGSGLLAGDAVTVFEGYLYFSFVTMTTLGFGDITPKTPQAAALVTVQAIAGQMYLAVLVARLVSLQITNPTEPEASP